MAKVYIGEWNGVKVYTDLLPFSKRRYGDKIEGVKFLVAHDTGSPNTTAQNNVDYYKRTANDDYASAHGFVDDKEFVICIPFTEKAWHVLYNTPTDNKWYGVDANDSSIGIEGSYFPNDKKRTLKSLDNYCRILGYIAADKNINVETNIPGHQDIQSDKIDPGNLLEAAGYSRSTSNLDPIIEKYKKMAKGKTESVTKIKADSTDKAKSTKKVIKPTKVKEVSSVWKMNEQGILWKTEKGKFTCKTKVGIVTRINGPWTGWGQGPKLNYGESINYTEIQDYDGYIWVSGKLDGKTVYVPTAFSTGNGRRKGNPWGTFI